MHMCLPAWLVLEIEREMFMCVAFSRGAECVRSVKSSDTHVFTQSKASGLYKTALCKNIDTPGVEQ